MSDFLEQEVSILAWSMATLGYGSRPLLQAISEQARNTIVEFSQQGLTNLAWSFAARGVNDLPLLQAISAASIAMISAFLPRTLANLAWAFAALCYDDAPLWTALSAASITKIGQFGGETDIANIAWSVATIGWQDAPLMKALSAAALPKISDFGFQGLANTAWSFAALAFSDRPLRHAIASAALRKLAACSTSVVQIGSGEAKSLSGLVAAFSEEGAREPDLQAALLQATEAALQTYAERLDARCSEGIARSAIGIAADHSTGQSRPRVIAEQPHVVVLLKPPGWTVTVLDSQEDGASIQDGVSTGAGAEGGPPGRRLQDWVAENLGLLYTVSRDSAAQYGLVHRLDRETSGVVLAAKSYRGLYMARLQFVARRVQKEYVCLCHGSFPQAPRFMEASLRQILVGDAVGSKGVAPRGATVNEAGKNAKTEVLSVAHLCCPEGGRLSLVRLQLHTGRRHQIRAHMAAEGSPLVADATYGGLARPWCPRTFLHAYRVAVDVGDGPFKAFCSLPTDLDEALATLMPESARARAFQLRWASA